jgi:DNA-directed RNA polymerase specialized sigma24 family protein
MNDTSASVQLRDLDRAMGELSIEQREVILLAGLEGMTYQAIAELLAIPIGTVRSRLARGRTALREMMGSADARSGRAERTGQPAWRPDPARLSITAGPGAEPQSEF